MYLQELLPHLAEATIYGVFQATKGFFQAVEVLFSSELGGQAVFHFLEVGLGGKVPVLFLHHGAMVNVLENNVKRGQLGAWMLYTSFQFSAAMRSAQRW